MITKKMVVAWLKDTKKEHDSIRNSMYNKSRILKPSEADRQSYANIRAMYDILIEQAERGVIDTYKEVKNKK